MSPAGLPRTTDGAIAFMQFWFDAVEYAYATGDTGIITNNSAPGCGACSRFVTDIDEQYASGGSFRVIRVNLLNIASAPLEDFGAPISLQVETSPGQRVSVDDSVTSIIKAAPPTNTTFFAGWRNGRWVAADVVKDTQ